MLGNREHHDIVTYDYTGNDGCSFIVSVGQPAFRNYEDRWYPVIRGMGISFEQDEYVLPSLVCYIPIPPGCEPRISCLPGGSQSAEPPGQLLVTPVMTGKGLDTEWEIPTIVPPAGADGYAELRTFRMLGTTVAAVTVNPFGAGITGTVPLELSVRLTWSPADGSREVDSPLLEALFAPGLLYWPVTDRIDAASPFWGRPWARMAVSSTGIYSVTGAELEQAGCEVTGTPSGALMVFSGPGTQYVLEDPTDEHQLSELAIEVFDGGDGIFDQSDTLIFFARELDRFDISGGYLQRLSHRYATHNIYWLTWGGEDGLRVDTVSAMPDASPEWGDNLLHRIWQEQEYAWIAGQEKRTGWVWTQLFENIPSYLYFSTLSADGNGSLTLSIIPEFLNSGPHRVEFDLNGSVIEDTLWSGMHEVILNITDLEFDPSMNLLKVTVLDEPGAIYLNYFMVEYPRRLSYAANRMLRFAGAFAGRYNFTFGGALSEFGLLDLTDPALPVRLEGQLSGEDLDVALDLQPNSQFWLSSGAGGYLSPDSIRVSQPGRIIGTGISGDVAIVVADQLMQAAEPLETIYARRGLSVAVVSAGEVYDEFGQGLRDPGAIRSFFRYTQDSWSSPPQSILLVGDGSYDPLMHITALPTLIPACIRLLSEDGMNYDDIFVIAHEDGIYPEAPISRIPVSSEDELAAYLSKVMTYESAAGSGEWENRILLVADDEWGSGTTEYIHTNSCELLADSILPASLERIKFYMIDYPWPPGTTPSGDHPEKPAAREAVIHELSEGCANMIFFGHGSYGQLAHEKLLVSSDVQLIDNGSRQPVMIFASCDLGHFDMISANCLAEDFALMPASGSIVSIGATRGTHSFSNEKLFSSYYEEIYGGGNPSIAEALWLAKVQMSSIGNSRYYIAFGDGGIHSVYPSAGGCSFEIPTDTLYRGRINTATGSFQRSSIGFLNITESGSDRIYSGIGGGSITYLRYGSSIYQAFITGTEQGFSASFFMPMQADTGSFSRGSAVGISSNGCEVAFDEWITAVDEGNHSPDSLPPSIELWIDGYRGETIPNVSGDAILRAALSDSSGICTIGGGAGRSILLSLDSQGFDVSRYFTYDINSYTCGEVEYSLPELAEGDHRIILVAWDGMGNSARDTLDFVVTDVSEDLLSSVFVYPNPGEGQRCFSFETSSAGTAAVTVYTVAGRAIWRETIICNEGYNQVIWNGLDMDLDEPGSGAYIYRVDFAALGGASCSVTDIVAVVRER